MVSGAIRYVLLIGNPTPYYADGIEGDIPMKLCKINAGGGYENAWLSCCDSGIPTDFFYANLGGNWDINKNGCYGEWWDYSTPGGVNLTADVFVGRIPVYNDDFSSLDKILQKTIDYENSNNKKWRRTALLPMSFMTSTTDGAELGEAINDYILKPNQYSGFRMYEKGNNTCNVNSKHSCEEELDRNINQRWNSVKPGIVCWSAHGLPAIANIGYDKCWGHDLYLMGTGDCSKLDDSYPAFTFQDSCLNGYPEASVNLQYSILKRGGIATVGATRATLFPDIEYKNAIPNHMTPKGMAYGYVQRLIQGMTAGEALYRMKESGGIGNTGGLSNEYIFNLYGDPSISIMGYETSPTNLWIHGPNFIPAPKEPFSITGTLMGTEALPWETVWLYRSADSINFYLVKKAITDSQGEYTFWNTEDEEGSYYYKVKYDGSALYDPASSNAVEVDVKLNLGQALDNAKLNWITGGPAYWFGTTKSKYYGIGSAQSGMIGDNQKSSSMTQATWDSA